MLMLFALAAMAQPPSPAASDFDAAQSAGAQALRAWHQCADVNVEVLMGNPPGGVLIPGEIAEYSVNLCSNERREVEARTYAALRLIAAPQYAADRANAAVNEMRRRLMRQIEDDIRASVAEAAAQQAPEAGPHH